MSLAKMQEHESKLQTNLKKGRVVGQPQNNMKICSEGRIRRSFPSATGVQNSYPSYSPTSWGARGNDKFSRNSSGVVFWLGLGHGTRNGGECCKGVSLTFRRSSISRSWPGDRDDEFSAKTKRGARNMNMKINAPCLGRRNEESERTRLESTRRWLFRIVKKGRRQQEDVFGRLKTFCDEFQTGPFILMMAIVIAVIEVCCFLRVKDGIDQGARKRGFWGWWL